jgi:protein phosphatase
MHEDLKQRWREAVSRPPEHAAFQPLSSAVALEVAAASFGGKWPVHNTDHYLAVRIGRMQETLVTSLSAGDLPPAFEEYGYALLIADGLGEQGAGARASRVALSSLAHLGLRYGKWNVRVSAETMADILAQGEFFYRQVNDAVRQASEASVEFAEMGTSLTALYVVESDLFFWHVGHSRAFLFRAGVLNQLTTDHTLAEQPNDVNGHATSAKSDFIHLVTESIGGRAAGPNLDAEHVTLANADRLLLCTNGLTDVVRHDQIADQLAQYRSPAEDCRQLIELARAAGSPDDITVVLADYTLRSDQRAARAAS